MNQNPSFSGTRSIPRSLAKNDPGANASEKFLRIVDKLLRFPIRRTGSIHLLFSGRSYSLTELAGNLNCSKQNILRYMDTIEGALPGLFRREKEGRQRRFRLLAPKVPPRVSLSADDVQWMLVCRDLVAHLLPQGVFREVGKAIGKASLLMPNTAERNPALGPMISVLTKGCIDYTPQQTAIETLLKSIRERRVCQIRYRTGREGEPRLHHLAPLRLVAMREALYLEGFVVADRGVADKKHDITLAVHRITDVARTRRRHTLSAADLPDVPGFGLMTGEPFRVRIRFTADVSQYVRERFWSKDQGIKELKGGGIELFLTCRSEPEILSMLLSFGACAKLLGPQRLVRRLDGIISEMKRNYYVSI